MASVLTRSFLYKSQGFRALVANNGERTLSQKQLVDKLAAKSDVSKADVLKVLRALTETVTEEVLTNGCNIRISKLGTFKRKEMNARIGRNPKTGEELNIAARNSIKFLPSASLKEAS